MMKEIESLVEALAHIEEHGSLRRVALQEIDFSDSEALLSNLDVSDSFFLGCKMSPLTLHAVQKAGGYVFQAPPDYPFRPFRSSLYSPEELYDTFDPDDPCSYCGCTDARIYRFWNDTGRETVPSIVDAMYRGIHDGSVNDALSEFIERTGKRVVAVMGGHALRRNDSRYRQIATLARILSRDGYLMISGGGPGAMEATHLGAMLADAADQTLEHALSVLSEAPSYRDRDWLSTAIQLKQHFIATGVTLSDSLGIPTWLYGHEPPTPFASHIAKFFDNSIREEGLVTVAHDGIIFAPGSAGTVQEIFQDAAQNHYATTGFASPMVFLGKDFWSREMPITSVLEAMSDGRPSLENVFLVDTVDQAVNVINSALPIKVPDAGWNFCEAYCAD